MKNKVRIIVLALIAAIVLLVPTGCNAADKKQLSAYEINAVYDEEAKTVSADMTVNYVNNTDATLNEVCFHLYPQAYREGAKYPAVSKDRISEAYRDGISYGGIEITSLSVDGVQREIAVIGEDEDILSVPAALEPTQSAEIKMSFELTIPSVRHRLGYSGSSVNLGNWYPIACVYDNGFDTHPYYSVGDPFYSECADYKVSITVPKHLSVATSGKHTKTETGETATYCASISKARDFAAAIGELSMLGTEVNGVEVNYYYFSDETPQISLTAAADAVKTFSRLYGGYPYESYSVVEAPFLSGGMEYPSLVFVSDEATGEMRTEAVVHETAHQWWYAAVGNDQVNHAWLDEGLSEFSTGIFYRENPSYGIDYARRTADTLSAYVLYYDAFKSKSADTSMTRPVHAYSGAFEYAYMSYVKGSLMLEAVRTAVGDEAFFAALSDYYAQNKFGIGTPDKLISCFSKASGSDIEGYIRAWLDGKVLSYGGQHIGGGV